MNQIPNQDVNLKKQEFEKLFTELFGKDDIVSTKPITLKQKITKYFNYGSISLLPNTGYQIFFKKMVNQKQMIYVANISFD